MPGARRRPTGQEVARPGERLPALADLDVDVPEVDERRGRRESGRQPHRGPPGEQLQVHGQGDFYSVLCTAVRCNVSPRFGEMSHKALDTASQREVVVVGKSERLGMARVL